MAKKLNSNLHKAKDTKNDEFYTRLTDIEKELKYYRHHFKDKTVFLNCDDPMESEFWRYFHLNFNELELKKLIATHYDRHESTYKLEYYGENDNDISIGLKTALIQNGDFRSDECIEILKESDIVVTNPPFSLFREYVAQLMEYDKKFLIIGNKNAITYKEFFPLLKDNKVWIGYQNVKEFLQPDGTVKKFGNIGWFTNLSINKRDEKMILWKDFNMEEYPVYDNYAAFNVDKVALIPKNKEIDTVIDKDRLEGFMKTYGQDITVKRETDDGKIEVHIVKPIWGVPITFLDKYNPSQIKIEDANECRSSGTPLKKHGLIKDKEGVITEFRADSRQQTADSRQQTADSRQQTADSKNSIRTDYSQTGIDSELSESSIMDQTGHGTLPLRELMEQKNTRGSQSDSFGKTFEIAGITCRRYSPEYITKTYDKDIYRNANDLNGSACILKNGMPHMLYGRILIKAKDQ